ncbi:hypothetical protein I5907_20145 [Panacibacter sp. DH6]|uniref:Uncharacterized protein n=1 Tax=Panacibacter microcysteis TaxID=2793269 RepID=A0A931H0A8_9BACT|nr:hypothetical protein [Panacibacter microcysteis]MBG9378558.1 hypothetical protein [Panacibacter microcysteis]
MTISLQHNDVNFVAYVAYNFLQVSDIILLRFNNTLQEYGNETILTYNHDKRAWTESGGMETQEPALFRQVAYKLRNVFAERSKMAHRKNA